MRLSRRAGTTEHGYVEERLSAYLDDTLSPAEQSAVERHLASCPQCQWSFETLRQTVQWTKELPRVPLPRVFTIPAPVQTARESRRRSRLPLLQLATAVLAVLFVFVAAGDVWLTGLMPASEPDRESVALVAPHATSATGADTEAAGPTTAAAEAAPAADVQPHLVTEAPAAAPQALPPTEAAEAEASAEPPAAAKSAQAVTEAAGTESPAVALQAVAETPESGVLGAAPMAPTEETEQPVERSAALQAEGPLEAAGTAASAIASGARVTATGGGLASPMPTLTAEVAAAAPTIVAEAPAQAAPAVEREGPGMALLEPVAPWLRIAEFVLGGAFLVVGAITAVLMLRRLRRKDGRPPRTR